ncbi:MAG: periplasmic heavy metal sensor [Nitrospira sp.]|nr:MAG: periplasmic heavy metal sensor [Nitrospira sp.]
MTTAPQSNRWLKIGLLISIGLNVLLVGLIVGRLLLSPFGPFSGRPEVKLEFLVDRITSGMSDADQHIVKSAMQRHQASLTEKLEAVRAAKMQIKEATMADTMTHESLQRSLERVGTTSDALRTELTALVVETLPELSLEGRRKVMAALERRGPPWMR